MKESSIMRISRIAAAVTLSTGLLMGCNPEVINEDTEGSGNGGVTTPTSKLAGGYWQLTEEGDVAAQSNGVDLPNVYVFSGSTQKYYNDDNSPGVYKISPASFNENIEDGTMTFTYYSDGINGVEYTDVEYIVESGELTLKKADVNLDLSGFDQSDAVGVKEAVSAANAEAGVNQSAQILDTLTTDTGELRLKLADSSTNATLESIGSGKLSADLILQYKDGAATGEGRDKASVSLFATSTSTDELFGEIILEAGVIKYRGEGVAGVSKGSIVETDGTYEHGKTLSIEAQWNKETKIFTFTINGEEFSGEVTDPTDVKVIAFRLGDDSATTDYELIVDNIVVTNIDENGDESIVFKDDFESYSVPHDLDENPYNSGTSEAIVISTGGDSVEPELGDFPISVHEFKFNSGDFTSDSGSDGTSVKWTGSAELSTTAGALGDDATAVSVIQPGPYGYAYYTSDADSGAEQIEGSFTLETVIKRRRANEKDVALIDWANTDNYLGYKLYIEGNDSGTKDTLKFKVYGGQVGGSDLSTEAFQMKQLLTTLGITLLLYMMMQRA